LVLAILNACGVDIPKDELMDNGKASYLEVLTAQETLLNAQLNEATNMYNGAMGIIALYIALGGATR
jgi:outer membrane protein TolC